MKIRIVLLTVIVLVFVPVLYITAQPPSAIQNYTIIPGTPPGGVGAACTATTYGYLTSIGQLVTCVSSVWTAAGTGGGSGLPCYSQTINAASFTATTTQNINLSGVLPYGAVLVFPRIYEGTSSAPTTFTGGAGTLTVSIGTASSPTAYTSAWPLAQGSPTIYRDAGGLSGSPENVTPVAHFVAGTGNLNAWSSGGVGISYCVITYPAGI